MKQENLEITIADLAEWSIPYGMHIILSRDLYIVEDFVSLGGDLTLYSIGYHNESGRVYANSEVRHYLDLCEKPPEKMSELDLMQIEDFDNMLESSTAVPLRVIQDEDRPFYRILWEDIVRAEGDVSTLPGTELGDYIIATIVQALNDGEEPGDRVFRRFTGPTMPSNFIDKHYRRGELTPDQVQQVMDEELYRGLQDLKSILEDRDV